MDKDGVYRCSWTAPVAPANSHGGGVTGQFPHYGPGEVQRGRSRLSAQESGSLPLPPPPIARDPVAAAEICLGAQGCWQPLGTRRQHCRLANPAPPYPQGGAPRPRQPGHSRGTLTTLVTQKSISTTGTPPPGESSPGKENKSCTGATK